MAGTKIKIELDDDLAQAMLRRVEAGAQDGLPLFTEIGSALERTTKDRFQTETETGPDGLPWADLQPRTLKRKRTTRKLVERGDLLNSIVFDAHAAFVDIIAGPTEYAAIHQFGGSPGMAPGPAAAVRCGSPSCLAIGATPYTASMRPQLFAADHAAQQIRPVNSKLASMRPQLFAADHRSRKPARAPCGLLQ